EEGGAGAHVARTHVRGGRTGGPGPGRGPGPSEDNQSGGPRGGPGADYHLLSSFTTVPPLSVHSLSLFTFTQPLPLHSFLPAQAWLPSAEAHSPLPLHELTPEHFTILPESFLPSAANWWPPASIPTTAA